MRCPDPHCFRRNHQITYTLAPDGKRILLPDDGKLPDGVKIFSLSCGAMRPCAIVPLGGRELGWYNQRTHTYVRLSDAREVVPELQPVRCPKCGLYDLTHFVVGRFYRDGTHKFQYTSPIFVDTGTSLPYMPNWAHPPWCPSGCRIDPEELVTGYRHSG